MSDTIIICVVLSYLIFFFFNDTATTEIYTLSLHDALPICLQPAPVGIQLPHKSAVQLATTALFIPAPLRVATVEPEVDRKSTRLNSSHGYISYAVFCLKKKKKTK